MSTVLDKPVTTVRWSMDETLRELNLLRQTLGLSPLREMPPGRIGSATQCPVANGLPNPRVVSARAISLNAGPLRRRVYEHRLRRAGYEVFRGNGCVSFMTPEPLGHFMSRFDVGHYPELVTT